MSDSKKLHVVGAGFSGLHSAYWAKKFGWEVTVYEKAARPGGLISSELVPDFGLIESAANSIIANHDIEALCAEMGLDILSAKESSKKRYLLRKGKLHRWPLSFLETLETIFTVLMHLFVLKPRKAEPLHAWSERCLGPSFTQNVLFPALQGVYGKEPSLLSATLVISRLFNRKKNPEFKGIKRKFFGAVSFKAGLGELIANLESSLKKSGAEIHYSTEVTREQVEGWLNNKERVLFATPLRVTAALLKNISPAFYSAASQVQYADLLSITAFFKKTPTRWMDGFGVLIPRNEKLEVLGVLSPCSTFPHRIVDEDKWISETWIFKDEILNLSDAQVLSLIQEERKRLSGGQTEPIEAYRLYRWPGAFPYYDVALERLLEQESYQQLSQYGIGLVGNWTGALSLSKMIPSQKAFIRSFLSTTEALVPLPKNLQLLAPAAKNGETTRSSQGTQNT